MKLSLNILLDLHIRGNIHGCYEALLVYGASKRRIGGNYDRDEMPK